MMYWWTSFNLFTFLIIYTSLDIGQGSQSSDKDVAVCFENSFCSVMTSRLRTSAVLFCNGPVERRENLIIKITGIYWLVGHFLGLSPELTSRLMFLHVILTAAGDKGLFIYQVATFVYLVCFNCVDSKALGQQIICSGFIFQWHCFHTIARLYVCKSKYWHSTVCSFITALRKSPYYCCNWIWSTHVDPHRPLFESWMVVEMPLDSNTAEFFFLMSSSVFLTQDED